MMSLDLANGSSPIDLRAGFWTRGLCVFFVLMMLGALVYTWLSGEEGVLQRWGLLVGFPVVAGLMTKIATYRVVLSADGLRSSSMAIPLFGPSYMELPWCAVAEVSDGRGARLPGTVGEVLCVAGSDRRRRICISSGMRGFDRAVDLLEARVPEAFDASAHRLVARRRGKRT